MQLSARNISYHQDGVFVDKVHSGKLHLILLICSALWGLLE